MAAIGTAPCRSVALRALRIKFLQQDEAFGLTAMAVSLAGNHADFRQMRLPWRQRRSARKSKQKEPQMHADARGWAGVRHGRSGPNPADRA